MNDYVYSGIFMYIYVGIYKVGLSFEEEYSKREWGFGKGGKVRL